MASIAGSSKNVPKKRKLQEENRSFNDEWLLDYFVTPNTTLNGAGSICLICKESISVNKEYKTLSDITNPNILTIIQNILRGLPSGRNALIF